MEYTGGQTSSSLLATFQGVPRLCGQCHPPPPSNDKTTLGQPDSTLQELLCFQKQGLLHFAPFFFFKLLLKANIFSRSHKVWSLKINEECLYSLDTKKSICLYISSLDLGQLLRGRGPGDCHILMLMVLKNKEQNSWTSYAIYLNVCTENTWTFNKYINVIIVLLIQYL